MADPMDYTMDDSHDQPATNSNSVPQCQYQHSQHSPTSSTFPLQSRDAHHYDPVHNTESWHNANGAGAQSRPPLPYAETHSISQWATPAYSSWTGFGEAQRGSQTSNGPAYPQQPGFTGMPHPPWGDIRDYEAQATPFGYIPGMYGGNGASSEPSAIGRSSLTASTHMHGSPMRRYPNMGQFQDEYVRRVARVREEAARGVTSRMREEREAEGFNQNLGSYNYLHGHSLDPPHPRRRDNPDWDSEDDDDPLSVPDSDMYENPYRAGLLFNGNMDNERRIAAARGALAAGKKVPSREFVASLEKLDPKDLKEADRTCMICYNEFGIQNPDGVVEQPIRLPKCKHVFGDKCIKKWFEDSDSCPYCRDKLPSELVHRKHPAIDSLYAAQSRRLHLATQAAAQAHSAARSRAGYPSRASDEFTFGTASGQFYRHSQEEYYIMRGSGAPDTWSHSPPNRSRDSAENRRRQARGRAGLARPTSVGSARLVASGPPNHQNVQQAHLQSITPNTLNSTSANVSRRSITPGLARQPSNGSVPIAVTPPRSRLSEASSPSSEEASPPVAVGSGLAPGNRHSPPGSARSYRHHINTWADPYGSRSTPSDPGHLPSGRPPNSRTAIELSGQTTSTGAWSSESGYVQAIHDINFPGSVHEALSGDFRWSR